MMKQETNQTEIPATDYKALGLISDALANTPLSTENINIYARRIYELLADNGYLEGGK